MTNVAGRNRPETEARTEARDVAERTRSRSSGGREPFGSALRTKLYSGVTETAARLLKTPAYIILFVSDQCWMKCAHCWFNEDWKQDNLHQQSLSFDEYEKLARSISSLPFLSITGGEAFQRKDIAELATMFRKTSNVRRYQIPTSGFRTGKIVADAEAMLRHNPETPFRVDVSLDGVGEIHDGVRRIRGGFDRAVATIKELNLLRKSYSHFDVGVITTISKENQHSIRETAELVERIHPEGEWMVNIARGNGRDPRAVEVDPEAYRLAGSLIQERKGRGTHGSHSGHATAKWLTAKNAARRDIIYDIVDGKRPGGGCAAGSLAGVIQSDGTVKACEMLDEYPIGNVRAFDYDLKVLWGSDRAREVRQLIQQTKCQCTQECFLSTSMLLSVDAWKRMVRYRLDA